jgi:hypothetical protein
VVAEIKRLPTEVTLVEQVLLVKDLQAELVECLVEEQDIIMAAAEAVLVVLVDLQMNAVTVDQDFHIL